MARGDKPYRVYRGGRTKGSVPLRSKQAPAPPKPPRRDQRDGRTGMPGAPRRTRRRLRLPWRRLIGTGVVLFFLALVGWAVASYFAFASGVDAANERLPPRALGALNGQSGLLLNRPTHILLLGTDHSRHPTRRGYRRADSIMLVRADPERHRLAYLSIPRDLRVDVPGYGATKINTAFQLGGPALAIRTVRRVTGLPIHHVAVVDFDNFRQVIDEMGGITVDVPAPVLSNRFDCPFTQRECETWEGWRFGKGRQRMDGRRALVYSRIRQNKLNPAESDITRGERQQRVLDAIMTELTSFGTLRRLPFIGDGLLAPLATDLSPGEFVQLGWVKFRTGGRSLHCRLGGTATSVGGGSFIVGGEENRSVITMVTGRSAPQPPLPGSGPFGPGCITESRGGGFGGGPLGWIILAIAIAAGLILLLDLAGAFGRRSRPA